MSDITMAYITSFIPVNPVALFYATVTQKSLNQACSSYDISDQALIWHPKPLTPVGFLKHEYMLTEPIVLLLYSDIHISLFYNKLL